MANPDIASLVREKFEEGSRQDSAEARPGRVAGGEGTDGRTSPFALAGLTSGGGEREPGMMSKTTSEVLVVAASCLQVRSRVWRSSRRENQERARLRTHGPPTFLSIVSRPDDV